MQAAAVGWSAEMGADLRKDAATFVQGFRINWVREELGSQAGTKWIHGMLVG